MNKTLVIMASALVISACGPKQAGVTVPALDLANLDTTVSPSVDFYRYATGGWQKNNPLKPEYARFGSFDYLRNKSQEQLNDLFKGMAELRTEPGSTEEKIVTLYNQGLDSVTLNSNGGAPLKKYLDMLYSVNDKAGIVQAIAMMHDGGESPLFMTYVESDLTDSDSQILYLEQSGLGIGERDYYTDPANAAIREGYRTFLTRVFALSGIDNPEQAAANALSVEDVLAANSWTNVQRRDVVAGYNPMSSEDLAQKYPGFDFPAYFKERNISAQDKLVVGEPSYFEAVSDYLLSADVEVLKDYLAGQLIKGACGALSDDYYKASFDFFSTQMSGIKEEKPRWKRAMSIPNSVLGEAVGKMYVEKYFPEESKAKMLTLVGNLKTALGEHIDSLDWMSDATKAKAHEKLDNFTVKIGYPDKWKDYSSMAISKTNSYYDNILAASRWYIKDNMAKLGKKTDRAEWGMTPQTVNAYYNPTTNEICFPAAILQPPFFNPDADEPVNYGGIGVVIGHEMSHGFDDQGRQFDKDGNMSNWWTDEDAAKFNEKAAVLIKQFDAIEILPGLHANGALSVGENIGDHGGISIAFSAMLNALKGKTPELIDGFTPEQRFYLSYATIWAQNITDEEKARLTRIDVHSLAENRVNASVRNFQSFFDAFGIKEGDPMWLPESERVHIW
ncbi:MAG: M13 family metallopeptidase [Candidatus Cryptobacteroides sp.]